MPNGFNEARRLSVLKNQFPVRVAYLPFAINQKSVIKAFDWNNINNNSEAVVS